MGVKICPQCGGKVSNVRTDCPHCKYDFASVKKCPDCEEQIDVSLEECPICGHIFETETSIQDAQLSKMTQAKDNIQDEQLVQNIDVLTCPYCNFSESMSIGNDLYMCTICKNRFLDTRGLPKPLPVIKKIVKNPVLDTNSTTTTDNVASPTEKPIFNTKKPKKPKENTSAKQEKRKMMVSKILPVLNIVSLIALIVGIVFLVFTRFLGLVISNGHGEIYNGGYILHAFSGEILPLFTVVSTIIVSISLLIQLYFDISKSGSFKKTLIINLLAIAFNTVAVVFGFITANQYWRYIGILLFAILASVCLLFVVLRLALTIVSKLKHICIDEKREGGKKTLALIASALLFCFVCGSMIAGSMKEDVTEIDDFAFQYYQNLTSIVIPDSVTSIGNASFCGCANLTSVIIPNSVTSIGYSAFMDCTSLTSVVIGNGVTSVGDYAFEDCTSLISITIPDSITSIESTAFYGVPLEKVTISTTTLSCISSCKETIKEVVISSGQSIGYYEFNGYYSLESIVIPESVTSIDFTAFVYCNNLKSIYYRGTEAKWNAILKENFERMDISNYTVTYNYTEN